MHITKNPNFKINYDAPTSNLDTNILNNITYFRKTVRLMAVFFHRMWGMSKNEHI